MWIMSHPVRILLVDDNLPLRAGVRALLRSEGTFEVVAEAGDGETAVRLAAELVPDVILMDVQMPGRIDGIEATRRIVQAMAEDGRETVVIALSAAGRNERAMLDAGAVAFVPKDRAYDLISVVQGVLPTKTST